MEYLAVGLEAIRAELVRLGVGLRDDGVKIKAMGNWGLRPKVKGRRVGGVGGEVGVDRQRQAGKPTKLLTASD